MPLAKFNRKKLIHWLSPLLILSLGIHGLALLVPIPERAEPEEEPESELLEPIQVSTLPPLPEAATEQPPITDPPPENPEPVVPEPVQTAQPVPAAAQPAPQNMPSTQPSPAPTTPVPAETPTAKPSKPAPATPLPYNPAGTTEREAQRAIIAFGATYGNAKKVNVPLALTYPAGERCIDPAALEASMAVAVNSAGGVIDGKVVKSSGVDAVNQWIEDTLLALQLPSDAFPDPANASGKTTADWIYEVFAEPAGEPLTPQGVDQAYLIDVTVIVEDNNC